MLEEKLEEIEERAADAWFISEVRPDLAELVAEVRRLRAMEERMNRLADAYAANVVMLAGKAQSPDGLLGIMAECSLSAAKMIRKAIEGE